MIFRHFKKHIVSSFLHWQRPAQLFLFSRPLKLFYLETGKRVGHGALLSLYFMMILKKLAELVCPASRRTNRSQAANPGAISRVLIHNKKIHGQRHGLFPV
jgi:hypothetical protein